MSLKGKEFTADDLSASHRRSIERQVRARAKDGSDIDKLVNDEIAAWATEQTERYRIVAKDGEIPIIAEEVDQRAINKLSAQARRVAGMLVRFDPQVRREVLAAFDADGKLVHPFEKVE
jgi:hypothetical protein